MRGVVGEGMPIYKNPFEKGDLYIRIEVDFPENYFANEGKLKVSAIVLEVDLCLSGSGSS